MLKLKTSLKVFLFFVSLGVLILGVSALSALPDAISKGMGGSVGTVAAVFCLVPIIVITLLAKACVQGWWIRHYGQSTKGVIISIYDVRDRPSAHGQPYEFEVEYQFVSQSGKTVNAMRTVPGRIGSMWKVNDQVEIRYDPSNWDNNILTY